MKKMIAMLLSLVLALSLGGCSLFTDGGGAADSGLPEVKITDTVTHEDPTDIEFTNRYALYSGDTCAVAELFQEQMGVTVEAEFFILYGDQEDIPVIGYNYLVLASEEDAVSYQETMKGFGYEVSVDGCVTKQVWDQEELAETIEGLIAMSVLEDNTAASYADMYKDMDELIEYTGE